MSALFWRSTGRAWAASMSQSQYRYWHPYWVWYTSGMETHLDRLQKCTVQITVHEVADYLPSSGQ
jgi:hypothetical protein